MWTFDPTVNDFVLSNQTLMGQFTMSYIAIGSIFEGDESEAFNTFDNVYRQDISARLPRQPELQQRLGEAAGIVQDTADVRDGFYNGYTGGSQDVLYPAFLAAYGPYNSESVDLTPFPPFHYPNWSVNYNGLSKLDAFKSIFRHSPCGMPTARPTPPAISSTTAH